MAADEEQQERDEEQQKRDEEQQERKMAVRANFLAAAGIVYPAFREGTKDEANAIQWFEDTFAWRPEYETIEGGAAGDMVGLYAATFSSGLDSEAKQTAEYGSERNQKGKRAAEPSTPPKPSKQSKPTKQRKPPKQPNKSGSSGGGSSSDNVPLDTSAGPAPGAVSALVTFLHAFASMSAEEQCVLLEKLFNIYSSSTP